MMQKRITNSLIALLCASAFSGCSTLGRYYDRAMGNPEEPRQPSATPERPAKALTSRSSYTSILRSRARPGLALQTSEDLQPLREPPSSAATKAIKSGQALPLHPSTNLTLTALDMRPASVTRSPRAAAPPPAEITERHTRLKLKETIRAPGWNIAVLGIARPGKTLSSAQTRDLTAEGEWVVVFVELKNTSDSPLFAHDYDFQFISSGRIPDCKNPMEDGGCRHFIDGQTEARNAYQQMRGLTMLNTGAPSYDRLEIEPGATLRTALIYDLPLTGQPLKFGQNGSWINLGSLRNVPRSPAPAKPPVDKLPAPTPVVPAAEPAPIVPAAPRVEPAPLPPPEPKPQPVAPVITRVEPTPPLSDIKVPYTPLKLKGELLSEGWNISVLGAARYGKTLFSDQVSDATAEREWLVLFVELKNASDRPRFIHDYSFQLLTSGRKPDCKNPPEKGVCRNFISGANEARKLYQESRGLTVLNTGEPAYDKLAYAPGAVLRTALVYDLSLAARQSRLALDDSFVELGDLRSLTPLPQPAAQTAPEPAPAAGTRAAAPDAPAVAAPPLTEPAPAKIEATPEARIEPTPKPETTPAPQADVAQTSPAVAPPQAEPVVEPAPRTELASAPAIRVEPIPAQPAEEKPAAPVIEKVEPTPTLTEIKTPYSKLKVKGAIKSDAWDVSILGATRYGKTLFSDQVSDATAEHEWLVLFVELKNRSDLPQYIHDYSFQTITSGAAADCRNPVAGGCRHTLSSYAQARSQYQSSRGLPVLNNGEPSYDKLAYAPGAVLRTALVYDLPVNGKPVRFGLDESFVDIGNLKNVTLLTAPPAAAPEVPARAEPVAEPVAAPVGPEIKVAASPTPAEIKDAYAQSGDKNTFSLPGWEVSVIGAAHPGKVLKSEGAKEVSAEGEWVVVFVELKNSSSAASFIHDYSFELRTAGSASGCKDVAEDGACRFHISGLSETRGLYPQSRNLTVLNSGEPAFDKRPFAPGDVIRTALVYDVTSVGQPLRFGAEGSFVALPNGPDEAPSAPAKHKRKK